MLYGPGVRDGVLMDEDWSPSQEEIEARVAAKVYHLIEERELERRLVEKYPMIRSLESLWNIGSDEDWE